MRMKRSLLTKVYISVFVSFVLMILLIVSIPCIMIQAIIDRFK